MGRGGREGFGEVGEGEPVPGNGVGVPKPAEGELIGREEADVFSVLEGDFVCVKVIDELSRVR